MSEEQKIEEQERMLINAQEEKKFLEECISDLSLDILEKGILNMKEIALKNIYEEIKPSELDISELKEKMTKEELEKMTKEELEEKVERRVEKKLKEDLKKDVENVKFSVDLILDAKYTFEESKYLRLKLQDKLKKVSESIEICNNKEDIDEKIAVLKELDLDECRDEYYKDKHYTTHSASGTAGEAGILQLKRKMDNLIREKGGEDEALEDLEKHTRYLKKSKEEIIKNIKKEKDDVVRKNAIRETYLDDLVEIQRQLYDIRHMKALFPKEIIKDMVEYIVNEVEEIDKKNKTYRSAEPAAEEISPASAPNPSHSAEPGAEEISPVPAPNPSHIAAPSVLPDLPDTSERLHGRKILVVQEDDDTPPHWCSLGDLKSIYCWLKSHGMLISNSELEDTCHSSFRRHNSRDRSPSPDTSSSSISI